MSLPQDTPTIPVYVDEVNLHFSATDFEGWTIRDLQLSDLRILDNGKPPKQIVRFLSRSGLPIHAGILVDTSRSMLGEVRLNQRIINAFSQNILRSSEDEVFLQQFDFETSLLQDWTHSGKDIQASLPKLGKNYRSRLGGSAVYDSIYRVVRDQFARRASTRTQGSNMLMFFSDGLDNMSHARVKDVIDICQLSQTSIYIFTHEKKSHFNSGQKILRELAQGSGGRIFYDEGPEEAMHDLQIIENDLRNSYLVVYKPADFTPDGRFHRIKVWSPTRGGVITAREGYYAPNPR